MKYPVELPVFEFDGKHYEARPFGCVAYDESEECGPEIVLVDSAGEFGAWLEDCINAKPLTAAARRLKRWSKQ